MLIHMYLPLHSISQSKYKEGTNPSTLTINSPSQMPMNPVLSDVLSHLWPMSF